MAKATTEISRSRKIAGAADCLVMIEMAAAFLHKVSLAVRIFVLPIMLMEYPTGGNATNNKREFGFM